MFKNKFTLVEMLIVVAIIGVLASIIIASLSNAREHAYRTSCASNLKQISTTLAVFSTTNRNYVADYNWMHSESMKKNYVCPKDNNPYIMDYQSNNGELINDVETSYGFNLSAYGKKASKLNSRGVVSFDSYDLYGGTESSNDGDSGSDGDASSDGDKGGGEDGNGNKGLGNNTDGNDSDNPHHGDGSYDDDENGGGNNKSGEDTSYEWSEEYGTYGRSNAESSSYSFNGIYPNDANRWYYNNLSFRHLGKACQLLSDGSVIIISQPSGLEFLIYNYDPALNYDFSY
jgi:prepilin-type N-terminal cleavage/methylation domain-containing protein